MIDYGVKLSTLVYWLLFKIKWPRSRKKVVGVGIYIYANIFKNYIEYNTVNN